MKSLSERRQAAFESQVKRLRGPAFVPNPEFQRETKDPRWQQACEEGKKPLCKNAREARRRAAEVARDADQRYDEHHRRGGT